MAKLIDKWYIVDDTNKLVNESSFFTNEEIDICMKFLERIK